MNKDQTLMSVFKLKNSLEHIFFKDFIHIYNAPAGFNDTHIKTLMTLKFTGPRPMSDISRQLLLEKGSFTPVANKLIKLGYVVKERSEEDKRVYLLSLTEAGLAFADDFSESHYIYINKLLDSLGGEQKNELIHHMDQTLRILAQIKEPPNMDKCPDN